jgi:hypothetical protein
MTAGEGKHGSFCNAPPLFFPYARRDLVEQRLCQPSVKSRLPFSVEVFVDGDGAKYF